MTRHLLAEALGRLGGMLCRASYDLDPSVYDEPDNGEDPMVFLRQSELDERMADAWAEDR